MDDIAIHKARLVYYGMFASFYAFNLGEKQFDNIVSSIEILRHQPIDEQSELSFSALKKRLDEVGLPGLKSESEMIFYEPGSSFIPMTASYYAHKHDDGLKRVEMINYILESKYRRNAASYKENEDHIEFVMLMIQALIQEQIQGDTEAHLLVRKIFSNILNGMLDGFCEALYHHEYSDIYRETVPILNVFTDFERHYLNVEPPEKEKQGQMAKPNIIKRSIEFENESAEECSRR